jgi:hypothetical protein
MRRSAGGPVINCLLNVLSYTESDLELPRTELTRWRQRPVLSAWPIQDAIEHGADNGLTIRITVGRAMCGPDRYETWCDHFAASFERVALAASEIA